MHPHRTHRAQGRRTLRTAASTVVGRCRFVMLVLLAAGPNVGTATAQTTPDAEDRLQPWQVVMTRAVTAVAVSPDGQHTAFVLSVPRRPLEEESGAAWAELHIAEADGTSRAYVTGKVNVSDVVWTAVGEIAFLAKRTGDETKALYVISPRGGEARKVLEHETDVAAFAFSPDGARVAFLAKEKITEPTEKLRKKGFDARIYEEDDLFTRLYLADLVSGEVARDAKPLGTEGSLRSVSFAGPDRLAVTVTPTPLIDDSYVRNRIRLLDLEGRTTAAIENPGKLGTVTASPAGSRLAFISAADRNDPAAGRLMVAGLGGTRGSSGDRVDFRDVLPRLAGHVAEFVWKDEEHLLYVAGVGTETVIGEVRWDGVGAREIHPAGSGVFTAISAAAGKAALVGQGPQHPGELYSLDLATGRTTRISDSNPWLDNVRLARQEVVRYRARDGLDLEGVLIYPLDYERGRRYPLILIVHGGPESHFNNGWLTSYSNLGQLAAARGFVTFYPNYRGSTGRGVEFSKTSQAKATGSEFDDYVDAVDHLIRVGLVDEKKVGITGGSYGGYASAWATTYYSERFAAAIPFVGISDAISKVGTTDIPHEMYEVHHLKWLWQDWDYFANASPIRYVERNQTPTLILHGEDDPRVHPSQSLELFRHLKVLARAPVRLVLYPGEGHGNTKSAARFDYLLRTLRWFEHYLKGPGGAPPPHEIDYAAHLPWGDDEEAEESPASGGNAP